MSTARELLIGLHEIGAGRRLKVAIGPAERSLLAEVAHARLLMHSGPAWRRFVYPGLDSGPWALGDSDLPVYLIDIGTSPGREAHAASRAPSTSGEVVWRRPRTLPSEESVHKVHATRDNQTTLCGRRQTASWRETTVTRANVCVRCYALAHGLQVPPAWPKNRLGYEEAGRAFFAAFEGLCDEPLWIQCIDEIEFVNEVRGDPRLWLNKAPDGYPCRLNGSTHRQLREMHRSQEAWERGIEYGLWKRDRADDRAASTAWAARMRFGQRSHVDDPPRATIRP